MCRVGPRSIYFHPLPRRGGGRRLEAPSKYLYRSRSLSLRKRQPCRAIVVIQLWFRFPRAAQCYYTHSIFAKLLSIYVLYTLRKNEALTVLQHGEGLIYVGWLSGCSFHGQRFCRKKKTKKTHLYFCYFPRLWYLRGFLNNFCTFKKYWNYQWLSCKCRRVRLEKMCASSK